MLSPVTRPDSTTVTPQASLFTRTEIILLFVLVGLLLNDILPVHSPLDPYKGGPQNVHPASPSNAETKTALLTYANKR